MRLTGLFLYPVKSCRGLALDEAEIGPRGFADDRQFLIVDAENKFLTQRVLPRLALISATLDAASLTLAADGHGAVSVPRRGPASARRDVLIWRDTVATDDCGEASAVWLTAFLGQPCRLVRIGDAYARPIPAEKLPAGFAAAPQVSFADAFPFLLISEASLADLNARLAAPVPMNRFRPSLVVAGCAAFTEDTWSRIRVGSAVLHRARPCARCLITTTDQATGERLGPDPLQTLAVYRRDAATGGVNFGQNFLAAPESLGTRLRLRDPVELLD